MNGTGNAKRGGYFVAFLAGVVIMVAMNGGMSQFKAQNVAPDLPPSAPMGESSPQKEPAVGEDIETVTVLPDDLRAENCTTDQDCGPNVTDYCNEGYCTLLIDPQSRCHESDPKILIYAEAARSLAKFHQCDSYCTDTGGLARCF